MLDSNCKPIYLMKGVKCVKQALYISKAQLISTIREHMWIQQKFFNPAKEDVAKVLAEMVFNVLNSQYVKFQKKKKLFRTIYKWEIYPFDFELFEELVRIGLNLTEPDREDDSMIPKTVAFGAFNRALYIASVGYTTKWKAPFSEVRHAAVEDLTNLIISKQAYVYPEYDPTKDEEEHQILLATITPEGVHHISQVLLW